MGELARQPGCPKVAESPLELLTPRPGEGFGTVEKPMWQAVAVLGGLVCSAIGNSIQRRPLWASLPRHAIVAGIMYCATTLIINESYAAKAEKDAVLKHYISLHPEDFPPFERKRYAEIYEPFRPVR